MNEKLNFNELSALLSEQTGIAKKETDRFLKAYFSLATTVITRGEMLKISGLGTFKPVWVADRTSVNVQTGESFKIAGHYKLSFVPEKVFREAVNAPFSCFETVVLPDDEMRIEEEEMVQNVLSSERSESDDLEGVDSVDRIAPEVADKERKKSDAVLVSEGEQERRSVIVSDENKNGDSVVVTTDSEGAETERERMEKERQQRERSQRRNSILKRVAFFLLLSCSVAIGYVLYLIYEQDRIFNVDDQKETEWTVVQEPITVAPADSTKQENPSFVGESDSVREPDLPKEIDQKPIKETITEGVFLTKLALKHFGNKAFWVYIYLENKNDIPNPNAIPVGTELIIPAASKYGIDASDSASVAKAKALADQMLNR